MIYTVTFNPSLDYVLSAESFSLGSMNRAGAGNILAGGKGLNVSAVLTELECENTALGFIAGFTGREIERLVSQSGCHADFIELPIGCSRINVKLKASGEETEINADGPQIPQECLDDLLRKLSLLQSGDILTLAGSIPSSLSDDVYSDIMQALSRKDIKMIVDASGRLLFNVLKERPYLIKPNHIELGEMLGVEICSPNEAAHYAKSLQSMGARNVLVSMADRGAVLVCESGEVFFCAAPKGKAVNSVGAGDSMVAGFIAGMVSGKGMSHALRLGIAAGSASAFGMGLARHDDIEALLPQIHAEPLNL